MAEARDGQIVTFYSFKGGTGRTMALANVAWILAANGKRVLAVDWDLESPGLPRYFSPFLAAEALPGTNGVIDLIRAYDTVAVRRQKSGETIEDKDVAAFARVNQYAVSLKWDFPDGGTLDFMSCGRQNMDYATTIGSLGWDYFYETLRGSRLFDALRQDMKANYDYALVDSRTGFSDIADICTIHLPDILVNCFTLNTQGIEGAVQVAGALDKYRKRGPGKRIKVLPVPMRVENAELAKANAGRSLARRRFDGLPADLAEQEREQYWADVVIPYQPFYAYEETLATFGDETSGPTTLLGAYERLTRHITDGAVTSMPPMETAVREYWLRRFGRSAPSELSYVLLDYEPEDAAWAEWVERVLGETKVRVEHRSAVSPTVPENESAPLVLTIISKSSWQSRSETRDGWKSDGVRTAAGLDNRRAIYVADMRPVEKFPVDVSEYLTGQTAAEAVKRLTRLVGCELVPEGSPLWLGEHYPAKAPKINNSLARNPQFTGRAEVLRDLRALLRERRIATVIPGRLPGGVGKTQLALEYVYRYKSEYDVIWWVQCGQPQFVDTNLVDLGSALAERYKVQVLPTPSVTAEADALAVAKALSHGNPTDRWLLVFDNADQPDAVRKFIPDTDPNGTGHVLITSRNRSWDHHTPTLDIDVFKREESIAHLQQRVPGISHEDADVLAEALGDLPLALALTGAWLKETGAPVSEQLRRLEQHGPLGVPTQSPLADYPETLVAALDSSLDRVRVQSGAAHRLLQLCSFLSGESIALGLVYSPAMVDLLSPFDPTITEPNDIAVHVQQLNRLALIKLDNHARQFQIHRLLQSRARQQLASDEQDLVRHEVHRLLAANRPRRDVDDPETWQRYRMIWPHLEPSGAAQCHDELVRNLMIDRVRYLWTRGPLPAAAATAREIERSWQARLDELSAGEDDESLRKQLLHLRFNLANILRDQAQYTASLELDTMVLEEQRRLLGPEHRHTLMTSSGLAADLRARGQYQEALKLAEETYESLSRVFGDDFPRTIDAANNLGISYRLTGQYAKAATLDEVTYEQRRATQGDRHPRTFLSASAIGRNLREAGRYGESVEWLRDLLASVERDSEPNPRLTAEIRVNLAASLRAAGRAKEAVPYIDEAHEALKPVLDPGHAEILACRLGRCASLLAIEQYVQADREQRTVLTSYRRLVGRDHPLTLVAMSNHVAILRSLGTLDEAVDTARDVADRLHSTLGGTHPYTLAAEMNFAVCLAENGELTQSRALDEQTAGKLADLLGPRHPDTLRAAANMALSRAAQGERSASGDLAAIVTRLEALIGREHPSVVALRKGIRNHRVLDPQPF